MATKLIKITKPYISDACLGHICSREGPFREGAALGPFIGATRPQKIPENGPRAPKVAKSGEQFERFCGVEDCRENCTFAHGATVMQEEGFSPEEPLRLD